MHSQWWRLLGKMSFVAENLLYPVMLFILSVEIDSFALEAFLVTLDLKKQKTKKKQKKNQQQFHIFFSTQNLNKNKIQHQHISSKQ